MQPQPDDDLSDLLSRALEGDRAAEDQLVGILYRDLRTIASRRLRRERPGHTWQTSDLVSEALLRLRKEGTLASAPDQGFLLKAASRAMHQLLIDHHRRKQSWKHGGKLKRHSLDDVLDRLAECLSFPLTDLSEELELLAGVDERASMVVRLRFFLGMSHPEIAHSLGFSQKTIDGDWKFARAWLHDRLSPTEAP